MSEIEEGALHVAVVGGSDAGIEAARRSRELAPEVEVTVLVADAFPNLSICGLPFWHSREVPHWQDLAHRTVADLVATGMKLSLERRVTSLDLRAHALQFTHAGGAGELSFDRLVLATGAVPMRPPIDGLADLGAADGVHLLHTMPEAFELDATLGETAAGSDPVALVVGAGVRRRRDGGGHDHQRYAGGGPGAAATGAAAHARRGTRG
jgi:NADPH-dependent 2,4-dienoyl-CoA reductase/sulfur reductase-like enzyme